VKVCLAVPYFAPELGAASVRAESIATALRAAGHEVSVVTPKPSYFLPGGKSPDQSVPCAHDQNSDTAVRYTPLPLRSVGEGSAARLLSETLAAVAAFPALIAESRTADLVYASSPPVQYALAAVLATRLTGSKAVVEIRDLWPETVLATLSASRRRTFRLAALEALGKLMVKMVYALAGRIVTVTTEDAKNLRQKGVDQAKILFAPNGADETAISIGRHRERLGSSRAKEFRIAYAGRLGPAQQVSTLLEAASLVGVPLELTIVGQGPEAPALRRKAGDLRPHRVRILDPIPREQVLELLIQQDAVYVPLASDTLLGSVPSKLFEALALGLPVILAARGESTNVVEDSGCGIVCEPGSASSLSKAIEELASSRDETFRRGLSGRNFVIENYRREDICAALVAQLEQFVDG
jgi:glycosyltransferase involved in cell wall biosynthesis